MKKVVWLVLQGNSEGRRGRLKHAGRNENTEVHETLQYPLLYIVDQILGINRPPTIRRTTAEPF